MVVATVIVVVVDGQWHGGFPGWQWWLVFFFLVVVDFFFY